MNIKSYKDEFSLIDRIFKKYIYIPISKNITNSKDCYYFNTPNDTLESYHLNYKDKNLNKNKYPFCECGEQ